MEDFLGIYGHLSFSAFSSIPYTTHHHEKRGQRCDEKNFHITMWRGQKSQKEKVKTHTHGETVEGWFKVTIPYGRRFDKAWLLKLIQSHCSVPFSPVDICISVSPSAVPYSMQHEFTPEHEKQIQEIMKKRYDVFQKALDLQKLYFDQDLVDCGIDIILNRRSCMAITLKTIERLFPKLFSLNLQGNRLCQLEGLSEIVEKVPDIRILNLSKNQLKSMHELKKVKDLKLEELWLQGNPLCENYLNQSAYVRYYLIYDYGDRQSLLSYYHEEACFSLMVHFMPEKSSLKKSCKYYKYDRNMMVKDPYMQKQLLKYRKHDIIGCLRELPKTEHNCSNFVVDMWLQMEMMLCFVVNGIFREVEQRSRGCIYAFCRNFITVLGSNSKIYIVNDELIVRKVFSEELQRNFATPESILHFPTDTLSTKKKKMVKTFSVHSQIKLEWSQK
ncbi:nuclear RNA export factor 2-like [Ctenodactylus gundi]